MCMVSVINDYGRLNVPLQQWTPPIWTEYQEILKRLGELDAKLTQPDCETPEKLAWQQDVERRLASLEQASIPTSEAKRQAPPVAKRRSKPRSR